MRLPSTRMPLAVAGTAAWLAACGALPPGAGPAASPTPPAPPASVALEDGTSYQSANFGYWITLPRGWRRSQCLSLAPTDERDPIGRDYYTVHTEEQEGQIFWGWQTAVIVSAWRNPKGLPAMDWLQSHPDSLGGEIAQPTTLAGRKAAKRTRANEWGRYYVPHAGNILEIAYTAPPPDQRVAGVTGAILDAIATSINFERPADPQPVAPAPSPPVAGTDPRPRALSRSPGEAVDALVDAFTRSDYARLQALIVPHCWYVGFYRSEGTGPMTPPQAADWLRQAAGGVGFSIRAVDRHLRPRADFDPRGETRFRIRFKDFTEAREAEVDVMLQNEGGVWYCSSILVNAGVSVETMP